MHAQGRRRPDREVSMEKGKILVVDD